MTTLEIAALEPIISKLTMLYACVRDIENTTAVFAGKDITVPAGDLAQGKTDTNALLAELKTEIADLTDMV